MDALEDGEDPVGDLVDLAHSVDLEEQAAVAVDVDQRFGLLRVDLLAPADDLLGVVGATLVLGPLDQPGDQLVTCRRSAHHGVER